MRGMRRERSLTLRAGRRHHDRHGSIVVGEQARRRARAAGVRSRSVCCVVAAVWLAASIAVAQSEPSAADRAAAGEAYDRGTAAFLAHDYARAATLFETAYRLAPSAPALIQAIRSHEHAHETLRAGSLALRLEALYGSERQAARQAHTTLQAATSHFLRVDVTCSATCTIELDGTVEDYTSFFVDPATAHSVRASFDTGAAAAQATTGAAGATQALAFTRPEPPPPPPVEVAEVVPPPHEEPPPPAPPPPASSGLHPGIFIAAAGLTLAAGGVLIWSAVDMYNGVPAYNANPTDALYQAGHQTEIRTWVLEGVTGALAVTSVLLAIFTDWNALGGGSSEHASIAPYASPYGAGLVARGEF
jgi:hypothetical protein